MKRRLWGSLISIGAVILAGASAWFVHGGPATSDNEGAAVDRAKPSQGLVAAVKVDSIKRGILAAEITVYGVIVPAAGAVQTITVPYESRVRRILVAEGQQVARGNALLEIEPSAETQLQTQQARNEYESAQKALQYMQQRLDLQLATNDQLLTAQQAVEQARAKLESMRTRGSENPHVIHADAGSLISKVSIQAGAIVPAGNPMIEVVVQNRLAARLGIEPADSGKIKSGQEVSLARVNAPGTRTVLGKIRKLSESANATSHLVDGFVDLPSSSGFLLNEYVAGKIKVASAEVLLVPRSAVLPEEDHHVLFTVKDGRAEQHTVQVGMENDKEVAVKGKDLHAGEAVVILGNYELKDGMAVKADPSR
jgi:membrane fusion protein, multidrug efflux system